MLLPHFGIEDPAEGRRGRLMQTADSKQREQALDPEKSFIVQSPAGSGKTELLIQRYLTLLRVVQQPEAVVAITFTRKAAGEMRRRIVTALQNSTGPRPDKPHEALTWDLARRVRERSETREWHLSENPGRLRIQTIDSLCASIARQMPWLSRLGGPLNIVEDPSGIYAEAARSVIELLEDDRWSAELGALLAHVDNNFQTLEDLIAGMLGKRDQWLRHIASADDPSHGRAALELALYNVIMDAIRKTGETIPLGAGAEIAAMAADAGANLQAEGREGPAKACINQTTLPNPEQLDAWLGIADTLLTKEGDWRKTLTIRNGFPPSAKALKQRCSQLISDLAENESLRLSLDNLRRLPDERFSESQWQVLSALVKLLPAAVEKLRIRFREIGAADYVEVAMAARRSLGDYDKPTDLALSLDCQMQHILIDEFQDTSVSQHSLLEALTAGWTPGDGRTIFAVGDPMQSIYRFREAEVGLFLKAWGEGIGKRPLEPIRLTVNFRSSRGIVDWVNNSFPRILPSESDISTGAISFCHSVCGNAGVPPADAAGTAALPGNPAVAIHPFIGQNDELEADRVVEIIRSTQGFKQGKIAVLVRARSHLTCILPALRAAGIRFRAVEIDSLAEVPIIKDLTALTRSLLHPADRIAWLALLRAPWCGMTLDELHAIAGGDLKSALWDLLRDESRVQQLNPEGRRRLNRVRSAIEPALEKRSFSMRSRIEGAWLALGGPACAASAAEMENAKAFFDLLDEMDQGGALDLEAFERRIEGLHAYPDSEADESLQIMTIHKAKGLEFDVVIAPGLGRKSRSDESRLMLWLESPRLGGKTDLLLAPIHATGAENDRIYDYLKRIDGLKSENESGRLLYVAATRAKSALHLLGHVEYGIKDDIPELKEPAAGSLLNRMWGVAAPVFHEAFKIFSPVPENKISYVARTPVKIQRLSLEWKLPALPTSVAVTEKPIPADSEAEVSFHWVGDTLRHIGTVVHRMLKRIAEDGISQWNATLLRQRRPAYESALAALGAPAAELSEAADRVQAALLQALEDERGKWLLGPHSNAVCEYALCGVREGQIVNARVDRTFIDDQGARWVVDYKSSSHEGAGVEEFLDNERERYREQLIRYRELFGLLESRPVRTALYFPLLNAWREID
jgi:ATP-dependent helicase/nuclease subunit A